MTIFLGLAAVTAILVGLRCLLLRVRQVNTVEPEKRNGRVVAVGPPCSSDN